MKMVESKILVVTCTMRFFTLCGGYGLVGGGEPSNELSLMNCHLHHNTAKKDLVGTGSKAYNSFWDEVADAINEFEVRVLSGDFNMALWKVVVELRARGVAAHIAAWFAHTQPTETVPRIDSTAIFLIGRCAGIRKAFDVSLIDKAAVVADPLPEGWQNMMEIIRDPNGNITERRPHGLTKHDYGKNGYNLTSYHPQVPTRMTQYLKWNFAPFQDEKSPAMAEPMRAGATDRAMFPQKVERTNLSSFGWPELPPWSQKLICVDKFDPGEEKELLGKGAHMPVMGFLGKASRRSPQAQKHRAERADKRGWTAERRHQAASQRPGFRQRPGASGGAWQEAGPYPRGGGGASSSGWWEGARWQGWRQGDAGWHYQ